MLDLRDVPVFVEAVEAGSFSLAAARLNLSRSAVAKTVARLEQRLGLRLFHRTTRRQGLTEEGRILYDRCREALEALREAEAVLESGRHTVRGLLRVTAPVVFGRRCVAPVLTDLMRRHPELDLQLSLTDRVVDLREEGYDLAVRNGSLKDEAGMMARRIAFQNMVVCASPDYLQTRPAPRTIEDLAEHSAILYGRPGWTRDWIFPRPSAAPRRILPPARLRLDDLEAILDAAIDGFGLAWLPAWLVETAVAEGKLHLLLEAEPAHAFQSHAVWPQAPSLQPKLRVAIDALVSGLRGYGRPPEIPA